MDDRAIFFRNYALLWQAYDKIGVKNYSYQDFRGHLNIFCHFCFRVTCICWGFMQFSAIWAGLIKVFHHESIIMPLISFILAFLPVAGPVLALICAHACWGWGLFYSMSFFILPYFLVNSPLQMIALFEFYKDWQRWKAEENRV